MVFVGLDDADNSLMELSDTVSILAQGIRSCGDGVMMENIMMHIVASLQNIRAQLDEAMTTLVHANSGTTAASNGTEEEKP